MSAAPADISERRIVYSVPGMDRVRVERDLTYRSAESADLKLHSCGLVPDRVG